MAEYWLYEWNRCAYLGRYVVGWSSNHCFATTLLLGGIFVSLCYLQKQVFLIFYDEKSSKLNLRLQTVKFWVYKYVNTGDGLNVSFVNNDLGFFKFKFLPQIINFKFEYLRLLDIFAFLIAYAFIFKYRFFLFKYL